MTHRTTTTLFLALVLLVLLTPARGASGQDRRTVATKVADILAQFPASSSAHRDRLAGDMLALGEAGIAEFTRQLVPAGSGDDTAVRFALNAAAAYASRFGAENERAVAERAFVNGLAAARDVEVRTFLMGQLQLVGREEAVKAATPFLADAAHVEPATQLMLAIRSDAARRALVGAFDASLSAAAPAPGRTDAVVTLVKALGQLKADEAHDRIAALARPARKGAAEPGTVVRRTAALAALARIASPKSRKTLDEAARAVDYRYDPANATMALVDYARNVGAKGDLKTSEKICRQVIKKCTDRERLSTASAALAILVEFQGHDALPDLVRAVDHNDAAYRHAALKLAERLTGIAPIRQWTAKAQKVDPVRRAEIVAMLGGQGDRRSLEFIRASLRASQPEVALTAAEALAHMLGAEATPDLLALLATKAGDEAKRVGGLLNWTVDERHLDALAALLDTLSPSAKAAALGIVAARHGQRFGERVFALTADSDAEVRTAAFAALEGVARAGDVPRLLRLLDAAAEADRVKDVQRALVAAATQAGSGQAKALIEGMKAASHPERVLELLPQIGGADALAAVVEQFERPALRPVAFRSLVQWKGHAAAERLFAICGSGDAAYRDQAFAGFVRQISSSSLPADQKLLQFRRILPQAAGMAERRTVLRAVERVKTFQSFLVAASFLDDRELANDAALAVMRIALPTAGARDGLSGTIVRDALNRVLQVLSGPEADYDKENIRGYLASMPKGEGFVPLFNGRDLAGWQGLVENPIARGKMTPEDLKAKQAEADRKMRENWSVRDGSIVFNGAGDNLCTTKDYRDFEMLVDWRITKGGDSGIYLRGTPQVQIWDTARTDVGAEVGSGGLYNNQKNPSKPLVVADNPVGEWNTLRITMIGDKVTVFLNGVKVVDNATMENYWERTRPIFESGPIELQAHGTDLAFRDVYVREISEAEFSLTDAERAAGFVSLFNGRNMDGWIGNVKGYKIEDGAMVYDPQSGDRTNLYTAQQYGDFQFRFEFQLTPGANSGVGIRAPREGDAAYVGMEIQVLDDTAPVYAALQPYQYHGSVYGVIPAKRGLLKPVGEWNSEEIMVRGSRIRITLNGTVIVDGDILEASRNGTIDHQQHPGLQRTTGHIGWLSHDSVVRFRNIRIKDLSPPKS